MKARFLLILGVFFVNATAWAYPDYAVRYNVMRCTACHISPTGGGPKTVYGKLFGAHGYKINPVLIQDYVSADFRVLDYIAKKHSDSKGGVGVMSASVAGHVALDEEQKIHLVIEQNVGGFQAGTAAFRDTYALFRFHTDEVRPHWFDSLMIGRFRPAFGIVTDEHRTYTRIQTATEWFTFETGAMLSGTPAETLHYDLSLVNGEKSPGTTLGTAQSEKWGAILNARFMPGPVMVGGSVDYHRTSAQPPAREAASVYSIISFGRMSYDRFPVNLRLEHVIAKNWNTHLGQGFAADSSYASSVAGSQSRGWLARADWYITPRFTLIYKYDRLVPDRDFPSDFYERFGLGLRYVIGPMTMLQARLEKARATHPTEAGSTAVGGEDAAFGLLQVQF